MIKHCDGSDSPPRSARNECCGGWLHGALEQGGDLTVTSHWPARVIALRHSYLSSRNLRRVLSLNSENVSHRLDFRGVAVPRGAASVIAGTQQKCFDYFYHHIPLWSSHQNFILYPMSGILTAGQVVTQPRHQPAIPPLSETSHLACAQRPGDAGYIDHATGSVYIPCASS